MHEEYRAAESLRDSRDRQSGEAVEEFGQRDDARCDQRGEEAASKDERTFAERTTLKERGRFSNTLPTNGCTYATT
jgi:hypothetical protein